jgi:hypothetical protein
MNFGTLVIILIIRKGQGSIPCAFKREEGYFIPYLRAAKLITSHREMEFRIAGFAGVKYLSNKVGISGAGSGLLVLI